MIRVVTAFTPDYAAMAQRLQDSCERFGVPISAYPFESRGSWAANNAAKPEMILKAMHETGDDCMWLDADMYLRDWPDDFPPGDVLLKFSDPPEAQVFDFTLKRNVPNTGTKLTPWGGHMLWRYTPIAHATLVHWYFVCAEYGEITNDEQCLMACLNGTCEHMYGLTTGPFDPYFIVHTPAGMAHGKPSAAEGWL